MTDESVNLEEQVSSITTVLLERSQRGEETAWQRLVDLYLPLILRWCRGQGLQDADVLDVGQEVLRRLAQHLKHFRRERPQDSFRGWLRRITKNAIVDHCRRQRNHPRAPGGNAAQERLANIPAADAEDSDENADAQERAILYERLVSFVRAEFSEQDWQAFSAIVIENRTAAEVAQTLGVTRNKVYLAKSRILRRLREEFGAFGDELTGP